MTSKNDVGKKSTRSVLDPMNKIYKSELDKTRVSKSKNVCLTLKAEDHDQLKALALEASVRTGRRVSVSELVRMLVAHAWACADLGSLDEVFGARKAGGGTSD